MAFLDEFKKFAMRGNAVDMAVGIIIGGAFGPIVASVVNDVVMPPIGIFLGRVDFKDLYLVLQPPMNGGAIYPLDPGTTLAQAKAAGAVVLSYGVLINALLNFVIVAFAAFLLIKGMNRLAAKEEAAAPPPPSTKDCPFCCSKIPLAARRCPQCTGDLQAAG